MTFDDMFKALTGHDPFPWQEKLYSRFLDLDIPLVCDIPTGLGKTSVIPIWLLALVNNHNIPRRLVYVVNRRTIVDQASELAQSILSKLNGAEEDTNSSLHSTVSKLRGMATFTARESNLVAISTLRGELADNKEWLFDPAKPAIIIGTIDMIGSKLLFSGYGDSRRIRPLHPGLLGCDTLLVHDEAHLTPAFGTLIQSIHRLQPDPQNSDLPTMWLMELSATHRNSQESPMQLDATDLNHNIIQKRFQAKKSLRLRVVEKTSQEKKSETVLRIEKITELALDYQNNNSRVVIYVQKPDDAAKIASSLKKGIGSNANVCVSILTGEIRGQERDDLVRRAAFEPFLGKRANDQTVYLVSTSAGEVGLDLHADHMVGDLAPLDAMIQRLGRVNRFGDNNSNIDIVYSLEWASKIEEERQKIKSKVQKDYENQKENFEKKLKKAKTELASLNLTQLQNKAIHEFEMKDPYQSALWKTLQLLRQQISEGVDYVDVSPKALQDLVTQDPTAFSPIPEHMILTDILLDLWSMTSLEDLPACPEPASWLHGIQENLPQTWIAWRHELTLLNEAQKDLLDNKAITRWFHKIPLASNETLRIPTHRLLKWDRNWIKAHSHRMVVVLSANGEARHWNLGDLANESRRQPLNFATLILPPECGSLSEDGFWHSKATNTNLDIASHRFRRFLLKRTGSTFHFQAIEEPMEAFSNDLPDIQDNWTSLRQAIRSMESQLGAKGATYIKLKEMEEWQDEDEADEQWLVLFKEHKILKSESTDSPSVEEHSQVVVELAEAMADRLRLPVPLKEALLLAAKYHDVGKQHCRWQIAAGYDPTIVNYTPKAKPSAGGLNWRQLAGYRHEMGSLIEAEKVNQIVNHEEKDLILHMIAAHHGWARPHFERNAFPPETNVAVKDRIAQETMLRYTSLQERFGWWRLAWLESLLRRADGLASAEHEINMEEE